MINFCDTEDKIPQTGGQVYYMPSNQPGPNVVVLGGVHGNEPAGIEIVKDLIQKCTSKWSQKSLLKSGSLFAVIANPAAVKADKRYVAEDLNRCMNTLTENSIEQKRARALQPILAQADLLLDVHCTIKPSQPMITIANKHHPLAAKVLPKLGIKTHIHGPGLLPPNKAPIYTDAYVGAHGGLGLTIEAGWKDDPKTAQIQKGIYAALCDLGLFDPEELGFDPDAWNQELAQIQTETWLAYDNIVATDDFEFTKPWGDFEPIPAGQVFAKSDGKDLRVSFDSHILFAKPKEYIVPGKEACILLARK